MTAAWTLGDVGDQHGRVMVVTGSTSGLGLETAKALVGLGAHVVLTARNPAKGESARAEVQACGPAATVELIALDLTSLDSIRTFADEFCKTHDRLDVLVNNAGVMATPLERTKDGFEMQTGTNHLGHVALTARVLPTMLSTPGSRVVTVSSIAHRDGGIDLTDLNWERRPYKRWPAYSQSKLANLHFAFELDRRLRAANASPSSLAAHPGVSRTNLGSDSSGIVGALQSAFIASTRPFLMPAADGALPQLRAALDPALVGGQFIGPNGFREMRGRPVEVKAMPKAYDDVMASALWDLSNRLTGAEFTV